MDGDTGLQVVPEGATMVSDTAVEVHGKSRRRDDRRLRLSDELMGREDSTDEVESTDEAAQQTSEGDEWEDW